MDYSHGLTGEGQLHTSLPGSTWNYSELSRSRSWLSIATIFENVIDPTQVPRLLTFEGGPKSFVGRYIFSPLSFLAGHNPPAKIKGPRIWLKIDTRNKYRTRNLKMKVPRSKNGPLTTPMPHPSQMSMSSD